MEQSVIHPTKKVIPVFIQFNILNLGADVASGATPRIAYVQLHALKFEWNVIGGMNELFAPSADDILV